MNVMDPFERERLVELDRAHAWKPFTAMAEYLAAEPLILTRAEGVWLFDAEGRRYLDGAASLWTNVHGHRVNEIDAAVRAQLERAAHTTMLGPTHPGAIELAARLASLAPGSLERVFFSDAGATAVEIALKIARQYHVLRGETARTKFLALEGAYHGDTLGAVSVGSIGPFHETFRPMTFPALRAKAPVVRGLAGEPERAAACEDALADAARLIEAHGSELAAVIVEPRVQGAAGMRLMAPGYLARLRELARAAGALLIADEVATGFGRTGRMFACEHEEIAPDLMCLGKGLSGGYLPLAATLATREVFEAFLGPAEERRVFYHGHTYTGNPLACAAALASLALFESRALLAHVRAMSKRLAERLAPLAGHPHVTDVRLEGLMGGVELAAGGSAGKRGRIACAEAARRGVWLRPLGDVVVVMPPLAIEEKEIDLLASAVAAGVEAAAG